MQGLNLLFGNVRITDVKYPKLFVPLHAEVKQKPTGITVVPNRDVIATEPQYSVFDLSRMSGWYEIHRAHALVTFFVTKAGEAKRISSRPNNGRTSKHTS